MRILIVDDEPAILESCKNILMPESAAGMEDLKSMADDLFDDQPMQVFNNLDDVTFDVVTRNQGELGIKAVELSAREKKPFTKLWIINCNTFPKSLLFRENMLIWKG